MSKIVRNTESTENALLKNGFWNVYDREEAAEAAITLYGADAATAVAFCALDAWTDGRCSDYDFWFDIFLRLKNRSLM
jgi:hypothetical protein